MLKSPNKSSPYRCQKSPKIIESVHVKKDKKKIKGKKKKKTSHSKSKNSFHQNIVSPSSKKLDRNKKLKKKTQPSLEEEGGKIEIIESKEFKELCEL